MMELVILLVLLIFFGIFSGSETALVALSMVRAEALVKKAVPAQRRCTSSDAC